MAERVNPKGFEPLAGGRASANTTGEGLHHHVDPEGIGDFFHLCSGGVR